MPVGGHLRRAGKPDERGLLRHRRQALPDKDGYAGWKSTFDERGNRTSLSYFGPDGKPCLNKDGYAGWKATFDERGNKTSASYFGPDGKPCLSKNGYAGWKATFDERGNQTSAYLLRPRRQALPEQARVFAAGRPSTIFVGLGQKRLSSALTSGPAFARTTSRRQP